MVSLLVIYMSLATGIVTYKEYPMESVAVCKKNASIIRNKVKAGRVWLYCK